MRSLSGIGRNHGFRLKFAALIVFCLGAGIFFVGGCARKQEPAIEASLPRVVSLAPSITEIICALGGERMLVGRTSACDYPPGIVTNIPIVGGFGAPSMEALLRTRPTLVLDVDLEDETIIRSLSNLGIKHQRLKCERVDDIPVVVKKTGVLLGLEERAGQLAGLLARQITELRMAARKTPSGGIIPTVFAEIWSDPLLTAGSRSFISEVITLAGGKNIGSEVARDYYPVSAEWVVAHDPDIIICLDLATVDSVAARAGWSGLKAVRAKRIYAGLNEQLILRPGPRVLEGIAVLQNCIAGKERK